MSSNAPGPTGPNPGDPANGSSPTGHPGQRRFHQRDRKRVPRRPAQPVTQPNQPAAGSVGSTVTTTEEKKEKKAYKVRHASVYWYSICFFLAKCLHFAIFVGFIVLIAWAFQDQPKPDNGLPGDYNVIAPPRERFPYLDPEFEREKGSKVIPIGGDGKLGFKKGE